MPLDPDEITREHAEVFLCAFTDRRNDVIDVETYRECVEPLFGWCECSCGYDGPFAPYAEGYLTHCPECETAQ